MNLSRRLHVPQHPIQSMAGSKPSRVLLLFRRCESRASAVKLVASQNAQKRLNFHFRSISATAIQTPLLRPIIQTSYSETLTIETTQPF